ncbi:TonB-dependent receptor [Pontibacter sp. BT310]|uniref:TonB-dependent receptor n=1 Tax=Pontibacter populi TaxID=890055 RepID=A0ABS6X6C1_9BACT|nr:MULTISPECIES: TonB-dependent receptor [Pontibacter]MBJ6116563.1 TonB-dependent receptor [Pontibacter sp. BT310]MBR0568987.1 TonB-dependent receptor [Microvirga sp. STS03]MBW3363416.1 TonB-dependent receptor [Pontibacter populi]
MRDKSKRRMSFGLTVALCCLYMTGNANAANAGGTDAVAAYKAESSYTAPGKQQGVTLKGKVVNENGEGLPGVTVVLKGTTKGTSTDINGNFSLTVPESQGTLILSFIGYTTQEVAIGGQTTFNVSLQPDTKTLDEIVVVGYGTQKKSDVTGSVETVSSDDFVKGQVTTPEQLIQGKVAGVQITSNSGAPGSGSTIRIRGGSSLNATNDPLIVIDGVPVENGAISGSANALSMINPNDIASFNILKDASATAIYGSRASNGVIIITTKKGTAGQKMSVNFSTQHSLSTVPNTVDVLNGDEYRALVNKYGNAEQKALLGGYNTDWQDQIYRNAYTADNNLSVSGAVNSIPYRVSVGYLNQDGILKTSNFERTTLGVSLNPSFLDDHLTANVNFKGARTNSVFANEGAIGAAIIYDPTRPVYSGSTRNGGFFQWEKDGVFNTLAPTNPLSLLNQRHDKGEANRWLGNVQLDYKFHFLPELRANLNIGTDRSDSEGNVLTDANHSPNQWKVETISEYAQEKENNLADFYLNYQKEYTSIKSRVDATAGYSFQEFISESPDFAFRNNETGAPLGQEPDYIPSHSQYRLKSYFGRLNYTFMDRYILTGTVRYDGSTRFSEDNRWGVFPALAFAWRLGEEAFLQNVNVLSDLKLRVGYGITGQQDIGLSYFPYLARYSRADNSAQYQFGDTFFPTFRAEGYDENIKWEETATFNAGLDFGFANNRLTGSVDYFFKDTKDLLAQITVAAGTNLTNRLFTNVGNMETKGLEVALNFEAISNTKLTWNIGVNGTLIDQKITNLSKVDNPDFAGYDVGGITGGTGNNIQKFAVGYAPYTFFVYKQVYDEKGNPVEGLYADTNGDGTISPDDRYLFKKPAADFTLGFNTQVNYGNWDLSMVLRGNFNNYVYNNVYSNLGARQSFSFANYLNNVSDNVLETGFGTNQYFSDYYIENASFLRMDNISLGYNFGNIIGDKVGLRATANVQNVFTITNYNGLDPELGTGIDYSLYPRPRVFSLGLNVNL